MVARRFAMIAAAVFAGPADSQGSSDNLQCEMRGENGMVMLLLCPAGLSEEALANEGKAACGERMPCGAWIWTNEAMVPMVAPDSHDKLSASAVQSARAIWVNEDRQLILLEEMRK